MADSSTGSQRSSQTYNKFLFLEPRTSTKLQQRCLCRVKLVTKENWKRNRGGGSSSLPSAVRVISLTFLWCIVETIKMFADYIVIGWCGEKKKRNASGMH